MRSLFPPWLETPPAYVESPLNGPSPCAAWSRAAATVWARRYGLGEFRNAADPQLVAEYEALLDGRPLPRRRDPLDARWAGAHREIVLLNLRLRTPRN